MSSNVAIIPPWKLALMERKRRQDKDVGAPGGRQEQLLDVSGLPSRKREIIVKKQHQQNTYVFMAKSPMHASGDVTVDHKDSSSERFESTAGCVNGHKEFSDTKRRSYPPTVASTADNYEFSHANGSVDDSADHNNQEEADERPIEERLLPIHRNPILRLDIEKRHHSSGNSARNSLSPRSGSESVGSHDRSQDRFSSIDERNKITSPGVSIPADPDCEVFGTEEDSEVTYGKGFVHKLLMKFSHLAATDQMPTNHVPPRQSLGSTSGRTAGGSSSCSNLRLQSVDAESVSRRPSIGTSRAKCHSVDDLLKDSDLEFSNYNSRETAIDLRCSGDAGHANGQDFCESSSPRTFIPVSRLNAGDTEDFPLPNIVSNTRSLFENLVTSPQPSSSLSPLNMYNRSSVGSMEKMSVKSDIKSPVISGKDLHQPDLTVFQNGLDAAVGHQLCAEQTDCDVEKTSTCARVTSNGINANVIEPLHSSALNQQKLQDNVSSDKTIAQSCEAPTNCIKVTSLNGYKMHNNTKPDVHFAQDTLSSVLQLGNIGYKTVEKSDKAIVSPIQRNLPTRNSNGRQDVLQQNNEKASMPTSPSTIPQNAVLKSLAGIVSASAGTTHSASDTGQYNDQEKSVRGTGAGSGSSKTGPSRPGMLLIRPASNLVAAKTKTEYLSLTKYNDVRKGEFAPAAKKPIEQPVEDGFVKDTEGDVTDGAVDNEEKFVFTGAGVSLSRSLLKKTKQGKQLQISFDDAMTRTFEYPSEQSLMDATPAQPGDCDYEEPSISTSSSAGLRNSPISGSSAAALSSYRSRMQVDYEFGMHVKEEHKTESIPSRPATVKQDTEPVKSPDQESPIWSKGASADLLF